MKILKFGGSSISSPERIKKVEDIIRHSQTEENRIAVVVSAFGDVTDDLIQMSALAAKGDSSYLSQLKKLEDRHIDVIRARIAISTQSHVLAGIKVMLNELDDVLHGVLLVKELTQKTQDFILSFGERLSAYIMAEIISQNTVHAEYLDARLLIKTDDNFGAAKVHYDLTYKNIVKHFHAHASLQVTAGFIGSTLNDETTTLGRGGSDYTASLLGAALRAKEIQIWTDVDGVLRADPRKIPNASPISNMTYEEAMEMSYFGAKVIYPPTIQPGLERKIPIRIKNTFNPDFEGTRICEKQIANHYLIKGISSIENISLLRIQGSGMIGVTGIAARLFSALAREKINIILITQASSEHSICFAVELPFAIAAKKALEKEFALEMRAHYVDEVIVENDLSIIAIIGENMRKTPGISSKLFQALGQKGINVIAIAQGSSELNISLAIDKKEEIRALNAIYETFYPAADEK